MQRGCGELDQAPVLVDWRSWNWPTFFPSHDKMWVMRVHSPDCVVKNVRGKTCNTICNNQCGCVHDVECKPIRAFYTDDELRGLVEEYGLYRIYLETQSCKIASYSRYLSSWCAGAQAPATICRIDITLGCM